MDFAASFEWLDIYGRKSSPVETHTYIEISMLPSGIEVVQEQISDQDFPAFNERRTAAPEAATWRLRVLLSDCSTNGWGVPYSKETLKVLQNHWHKSSTSLTYPTYMTSSARFNSSSPELSRKGLRLATWKGCRAALSVSHDPITLETFATVSCDTQWNFNRFCSILMSAKSHAYKPQLLPFILIAMNLESMDYFLQKPRADFYAIARSLQCDSYNKPDERTIAPDITDMPRVLTALAFINSDLTPVQKAIAQQIVLVTEFADEFPDPYSKNVDIEMQNRLRLLGERCREIELDFQEKKESLQAMVQMVYAILQQRDNELNRRYAADMRVITAITLVFLPGTFIATLFSTSFWNFDPRSDGSLVSSWVWLYFCVTFGLTLIVLSIWRGYTALKQSIRAVKYFWHTNRMFRWLLRKPMKPDDEEAGKKGD